MFMFVCMRVCMCLYVYVYVCMCGCVYECMYVSICICVCVYVCLCMWIHMCMYARSEENEYAIVVQRTEERLLRFADPEDLADAVQYLWNEASFYSPGAEHCERPLLCIHSLLLVYSVYLSSI
eukprot:GHVU01225464.1.p2 GENE.GHVU01225464.1~~GHVU01225464.1.p2  ORF type:complete len:123 (+),score=2.30 GHVU01225464.1:231-599(+)